MIKPTAIPELGLIKLEDEIGRDWQCPMTREEALQLLEQLPSEIAKLPVNRSEKGKD